MTRSGQVMDPEPVEQMIVEARNRLGAHAFDALESVVSPGALHRSVGVGRDTAYRLFRGVRGEPSGASRVLIDVARSIEAPDHPDRRALLEAVTDAATNAQVDADSGLSIEDARIIAALRADLEACIGWAFIPAAQLLNVACMSASPLWADSDAALDDTQRAVADAVIESRRRDYQETTRSFMPLLRVAMSARRIRPRPEFPAEVIVALIQALLDGALMRMAIEPDLLDVDTVARAMHALGIALSEHGSFHQDPRRPATDPDGAFDRVVAAAETLWRNNGDVDLTTIGSRTEPPVDVELVAVIFPTVTDLADSVARTVVIGGDVGSGDFGGLTITYLRETIRRLNDAVTEMPALGELLHDQPVAGTRFVDLLTDDITQYLAASDPPVPDPAGTAQRLVDLAFQGPVGWAGADGLLTMVAAIVNGATDT